MYAIKHVTGIIEFSDSDVYVEEGAECITIPDDACLKLDHYYDISDGKLVDMKTEFPSENVKENEDADLG